MLRLSRRRFLQTSLATATLSGASSLWAQGSAPAPAAAAATLQIGSLNAKTQVPQDFIGLSYEVMQLEDPAFFSAANTGLIEQFRKLSPNGVLRLGGNTSEFSWWKAKPADQPPVRKGDVNDPGQPPPTTLYAVTPEAIRNLGAFLQAAGWTCIYGLNLGYGTPEIDLQEATVVYQALGKRLQYFQIGNEVDLFGTHLRPKATWTPAAYLENWLSIARPVQKALPEATFGMPDVAADAHWLPQLAELWKAVPDKPRVTTLSHHYYFGGPPKNPDVNIDRLLHPDSKVKRDAGLALPAAAAMHARLRMTEGNTCYQGGKPGVSDVLASALWSAGYLLELMQLGYAGVNLHGGSGHAVAVSVGGILRGEQLMADPNAPHAKPFYTPIANVGDMPGAGPGGKLDSHYRLQPVGLGMQFAGAFACTTMLPVDFNPGGVNAMAYAAKRADGRTIVAILNKDPEKELAVDLPAYRVLQTLTGLALDRPDVDLSTFTQAGDAAEGTRLTVAKHSAKLILLG